MKSIKALVLGSAFIIIAMLVLQLVFIFIAVGYNSLAASYPFLREITEVFRYLLGIPVFIATLFFGGYVTAASVDVRSHITVLLHCLILGILTVSGMTYFAMDYMALTVAGYVTLLLSLSGVVAGGLYWLHKQKLLAA